MSNINERHTGQTAQDKDRAEILEWMIVNKLGLVNVSARLIL